MIAQPVLDIFEPLVHGIVSVTPPTVRCDGCGFEASGGRLALLVMTCGIVFNPLEFAQDKRRLCAGCRAAAGWREL